jgi:hypothetical protein
LNVQPQYLFSRNITILKKQARCTPCLRCPLEATPTGYNHGFSALAMEIYSHKS